MHETSGVIRKIIDKGADGLRVSLLGHDGYFRIAAGTQATQLRPQLEAALAEKRNICLVHDAALSVASLK